MKTLQRYGKAILLILALSLPLFALGCGAENTVDRERQETDTSSQAESGADDAAYTAQIEVEGYGTITVELDGEAAPETVANFVSLAREGFYDGLTFHRIIEGFMIQGGDPNGDGTGGSGQTIKGEFADNGVENNIPHTRGTISMARASDPDSASSQFFIMQETTDSLDGQYAAFGTVTSGMEVVDAICEGVTIADEQSGLVTDDTQPVIASITLVD